MKIIIVGPGAMGCLFAGLLVEAGQKDVWLLDKHEKRAREITKNGLKIEGIGGSRSVSGIRCTANPQETGIADLILIFVKSYDTAEASHSILPVIGINTTILTLQNGLTNINTISDILGADRVIAGITAHGATMLGTGHIRHAGVGETTIGELESGQSDRTKRIADVLSSAGFQTVISDNIHNSIWAKLIINAAINPLTAITKLKNGALLEYNEVRKLLGMTAEEAARIALARQIALPYDSTTSAVEAVCKATSANVSSMLQDVLRHKRTEIDAINGAIVNEAKKAGIEAPINETLTYLVKGIERGAKDIELGI
ncbi:ketopantoate reductase family protein [Candidatus Poribacteria bacterium]